MTTLGEVQPKLYSIAEISALTSLSKAFLRNEIRAGKLQAKSFGRRVLVTAQSLDMYYESKKDWTPANSNGENN